jgi:hypothetical protein
MKALSRDPADRYASASDLRAALLASGATTSPDPDLTGTLPALGGTVVGAPLPAAGGPSPTAGAAPAPSFARSERGLLIPVVIVVVVAVALGIAGLLIRGSGAGSLFHAFGGGDDGGGTTVPVASARAFDPSGDGHENDASTGLAIDGKADTGWKTEGYNDRDITKLKDGVGLILQLDGAHDLTSLEVVSPTDDWTAAIYVADAPKATLAEWGRPVTTKAHLGAGTNDLDLHGTRGGAVLVWILDRGDAPGRAGAEIDELTVTAR